MTAGAPVGVYEGGNIPYTDNFVTQIIQLDSVSVGDVSSVVKELAGKKAKAKRVLEGAIARNPYAVGPRLRLAKVYTDLPLAIDRPIEFGVQQFCLTCKKCARKCRAQQLSGVFPSRLFSARQMRLVRPTFGHVGRVVSETYRPNADKKFENLLSMTPK